jgi:hypothetical protein
MLTLAGRSWLVVHFSEAYSQGMSAGESGRYPFISGAV